VTDPELIGGLTVALIIGTVLGHVLTVALTPERPTLDHPWRESQTSRSIGVVPPSPP